MRVSELVAHQRVVSCGIGDTCNEAAKMMWENDLGALPVLQEDGTVTGMVTDRDICMACYTTGKAPNELRVSRHMSERLYCCTLSTTVSDAEVTMRKHQVRRLPVVDHPQRRHLVGMLSLADIARKAEGERGAWLKEIPREEVTDVLADISRPRK